MAARHVLPPGAKADEEQLLKIVANQVAIAVENARLYEEIRQQLQRTETLLAVGQAVGSTLDLTEIIRRTTKEMVRALGADMGGAWLLSPKRDCFFPVAGYHVPKELLKAISETPVFFEDRIVEEMKRLKGPVSSSESQADPTFDSPLARLLPHKSTLVHPMWAKGELIGGFAIAWLRETHRFIPEELRLAEGIARQAGLAIENSRLYEDLKGQMAELTETQAQLIQSAKLAAIGELAANIGHEINNPLTSVLGFASYLAEQAQPDDPMREELTMILDEATRARDIVRDLLDFSRRREFTPEPADLNAVVEQTVAMLRRQGALDAIALREIYASDLPMVEVDVPRIKQVFLNIINNAIHAMPHGGSLTLRTAAADNAVAVEFTDTGTGIAPGHLDKIFDPFFTTKPEVSGTGLGLSVSLGIVQSHGGSIEVRSEVGKGSTFTVRLPAKARPRPGAPGYPRAAG